MEKNTQGWIDKYRPSSITDIIGHSKIKKELVKRIKEDTLRQNILLSGNSGIGKTTIGRIIAKTLNCENPNVDNYESIEHFSPCNECNHCKAISSEASSVTQSFHFYDGSELGKDAVLSIKKLCSTPSLYGGKRIIFIDEIQNIANGKDSSLQALLKLIEKDYQGKVYFIMSTMNIKKIPKSVVNRFQIHFRLKPIPVDELIMFAGHILESEGLLKDLDLEQASYAEDGLSYLIDKGLFLLAESCNGDVREFVGNLETCIHRELYKEKDIIEHLGILSSVEVAELIQLLLKKDKTFFKAIKQYEKNLEDFYYLSYSILTDLMIFKYTGECRMSWQESRFQRLKNYDTINELIDVYNNMYENMSYFRNTYFLSCIGRYLQESSNIIRQSLVESKSPEPVRRRRKIN